MNTSNTSHIPMAHVTWDCTYHIVICPKYRKRKIYGILKKNLWKILTKLLGEMKIEKLEWNLWIDHIHLQLKIPPSLSVSKVIGTNKGKSAIRLHNQYGSRNILPTNTSGHEDISSELQVLIWIWSTSI